MLDIRLIREDPDRVKRAMKTRNKDMDAVVDEIIAIDQKRRELASKRDGLKAEQNNASKLIPQIKKSGGDISEIMQKMNKVKEAIKADEDELNALEQKQRALLLEIPNIPSDTTPVGKDDSENV